MLVLLPGSLDQTSKLQSFVMSPSMRRQSLQANIAKLKLRERVKNRQKAVNLLRVRMKMNLNMSNRIISETTSVNATTLIL